MTYWRRAGQVNAEPTGCEGLTVSAERKAGERLS